MAQTQPRVIDTETNTEIRQVFVKNFEWVISFDKELNLGHPIPGRAYRAVYNKQTKTYRIVYNDAVGGFQSLFIPLLVNNDRSKAYTSEIYEITIDNVLDFDILEEDLDNLLLWQREENKDLLEALWKKPSNAPVAPPHGQMQMIRPEDLPRVLVDIIQKNDPELGVLIDKLLTLREINPAIVGSLFSLVHYLLNSEEPRDSPIDGHWLRLDSKFGAGANLSAAISKLSRYVGTDRRTNLEHEDLMGAIKDLLIEQQRRDLNS